jgi:hypothetical protein
MERTTRTVETPGGHSIVMYDYITGGEMQAIARMAPKNDGDNAAKIEAGNETTITLVRQLDGSADNLLARILELPLADYMAISAEVQAIIEPEKKA